MPLEGIAVAQTERALPFKITMHPHGQLAGVLALLGMHNQDNASPSPNFERDARPLRHVVEVEAFRQLEVQLNGSTLMRPLQCIHDHNVNL